MVLNTECFGLTLAVDIKYIQSYRMFIILYLLYRCGIFMCIKIYSVAFDSL